MYQSEIWRLKEDIQNIQGFEACKVMDGSFSGIQILGVRKIPNARGLHCVFVDLENYRGTDNWVVLNNQQNFTFNKPANEVASHVDIYSTDNQIQIRSKDGKFSQKITGLSFAHTVYGHSSYYVYAKFTNDVIIPQPTESEAQKLLREIEERTKRLKELVK